MCKSYTEITRNLGVPGLNPKTHMPLFACLDISIISGLNFRHGWIKDAHGCYYNYAIEWFYEVEKSLTGIRFCFQPERFPSQMPSGIQTDFNRNMAYLRPLRISKQINAYEIFTKYRICQFWQNGNIIIIDSLMHWIKE